MLKLKDFTDFYKKTAKEMVDKVDEYESLQCDHIVSYSVDKRINEFIIKFDFKTVLYLQTVTTRTDKESVSKWQIKTDAVDVTSDEVNDRVALSILKPVSNLLDITNNSIKSYINNMMVKGVRY